MNRLLADENVPRASVDALRAAGFDVASVAETSAGASDETAPGGRLIFRQGLAPPPGVIYLRFVPADPDEAARVLRDLLKHHEIEVEGRFTVATRDQVRQRPLP
ncbi:MAG: DUF5615 family PIN-like protein [Gemmatimonadota bacterium]|nr:DUF5615 family PIN-like protein [Gemmatimonadota bacterium]